MVTVLCQGCGRKLQLNEQYVSDMLASGELVEATKQVRVKDAVRKDMDGVKRKFEGESDEYVTGLFDLCKVCRRAERPQPGDAEFERERRIQYKIAQLKQARPDLDFDARVHAAVEEEFNPKYEKNSAFRNYLLERQGL